MIFFVTKADGQLGHDVVNEIVFCGHIAVGSVIAPEYVGVVDGVSVTKCEYCQLNITDAKVVEHVLMDVKLDAVIRCAACAAVEMAEDADKQEKISQSMSTAPKISHTYARPLILKRPALAQTT